MKIKIRTVVSGIAAEVLFSLLFAAIGLLLAWICWVVLV
jgi:hypothetical protein